MVTNGIFQSCSSVNVQFSKLSKLLVGGLVLKDTSSFQCFHTTPMVIEVKRRRAMAMTVNILEEMMMVVCS